MAEDTNKGRAISEFAKALRKRAKKKYIGNSLAISLAEVPHTPLQDSYWNTFHCCEVIEVAQHRATSTYCKNRWCLNCQSIRIATLMNKYGTALDELEDPYFVTLTAPNVEGWQLKEEIERFRKCWRKITDAGRRRANFKGLRKCECTARPGNTYHFHYHIIVSGRDNARWMVERWLRLNFEQNANEKAQDMRPFDKRSRVELFKYFTKLTAYDKKAKARKKQDPQALDTIFVAMRNTRVFQSFGGFEALDEDAFDITSETTELAAGIYAWYVHDWQKVEEISGKPIGPGITGFKPTEALDEFWGIE